MTPEQAADLAARTLAAIDAFGTYPLWERMVAADRERVASDLAGLRECWNLADMGERGHANHARRYADNLRRTAALYGETP